MNDRQVKMFVKDRDDALMSLNKKKILKFQRKWGINFQCTSDRVFWMGVHSARVECLSLPFAERQRSVIWLEAKGSTRLDGRHPRGALAETPPGPVVK